MKWNKRMKEGYSCLDLIISAEKNAQSWQWETKSLRTAHSRQRKQQRRERKH